MGKSWTYSYDAGGNITSKREYAYTAGTLGSILKTYSYTYGNGMKDRLTAWNGKSFAYDSCGNPTKYKGDSMSWQRGRLLSSYTKGGKTYTFNYDINGIRRKKTAGMDSTEYLISDGKLIQQNNYTSGSSTPASKIVFLYSNDGITGCVINNVVYKYEKDISGNVVSLLSGIFQVARYEYDAWGNCKVLNPNGTENTSATFAGNINPIRYRSYYYDSDIGLYYLQTRYYDPETGRFINLDQIEYIDPEQLNGLNLYAYCLNNPVMGYDPDGTFWFTFLTTLIGGLVGAVVGIVDYALNNDGEFDIAEFRVKAVSGFASGATAGFILGITKGTGIKLASYASAAVYSAGNEIGSYITGEKELTWENVGKSVLTVIGDTAINGTMNYIANKGAAKLVPTNSGWFIPKKFLSYFTKSYGQKMMAQTAISGGISNILNLFMRLIKGIQ